MRHLFYVSKTYSVAIMRPLQDAVRRRGESCAWFFAPPLKGDELLNGDDAALFSSIDDVFAFNPEVVYVPGNTVPDFFPGLKVQLLHGLATDKIGKMGHYRIRGFFDLYCTHGPEGTNKFESLQASHPHFRVVETGWPKLDPLFQEKQLVDVRTRDGIAADKRVIIYAPTFSPSITSAKKLYQTISDLSTSKQWHWLIKFHPKMDAETVAKYRALVGSKLTFYESHDDALPLMHAADIMLSDNSSIAIEFLMLDKPLVTFGNLDPGPHLVNVSQPDELEGAIEQIFLQPNRYTEKVKAFVDRFHPYRDGRSSERVIDAVSDFVQQGQEGLKPKPFNLVRKWKIRKKLGYYRFS